MSSEYHEPDSIVMAVSEDEFREYVDGLHATKEPTEEPQPTYGPWMLVSDGNHDVPDTKGLTTVYRDGELYKWRIKLQPVVQEIRIIISSDGQTNPQACHPDAEIKHAIITVKGDDISIRWSDK
jgi:hypothetical protein